jgi:uncharacterized protein YgiM (DUF1202 family)
MFTLRTLRVLAPALLMLSVLTACSVGPFRITVDTPTTIPPTFPTPTPAGVSSAAPMLTATTQVNVRGGDGTQHLIIDTLIVGDSAPIIGIGSNDQSWYAIRLFDGRTGFVSADFVTTEGDLSNLPRIDPLSAPNPPNPTPQPISAPDLRVTDISIEHNPVLCGDLTTILITVTNAGDSIALESIMAVNYHYLPIIANSWISQSTISIPALLPGESYVATFGNTLYAPGDGTYALRAVVDWGDNLREHDEANNMLESNPVVVRCSPPDSKADLRVGALMLANNPPVCGDRTSIPFVIANTGSTPAPESTYLLEVLNAEFATLAEVSGTVPPIAAASSYSGGADLILSANGNGLFHVRVTVDIGDVLDEDDESNNVTWITYQVECGG